MKAREWLQRGREQVDPIDRLTNYWRAFNNLYFPINGQNERDKIQKFLEQSAYQALTDYLIENHCEQIQYLLEQPVIDMRGNGRDTASNIERYLAANTSAEKVSELFMIIYQVRCNLEHGQKSPFRDRDVELCRAAAPLVEGVVEACA